ncbi:MAG: hypothetical protein ACREME_08380 [Gemmatimonadales bacterium]
MMAMTIRTVLLLTGLLTSVASVEGQQGGCLPADDEATGLLSYALELATSTDPEVVDTRKEYGILQVAASEVELVTNDAVCKTAGREYKSSVGLNGPAPAVHVVRIGTRYIVETPEALVGEFVVHVVFDSDFNELAQFGG